jgi:prepilin-type N-terminal cleavage/methylation domain-containing protein
VIRLRQAVAGDDNERGMTLVEVVMAISILGILATVALGLYMSSLGASNSHQNRELAITVANESMELAASWSVGSLAGGRHQPAVTNQWVSTIDPVTSKSVIAGIGAGYPLWDSSATAVSVPALPLMKTATFSGTEFSVQTFISRCYQPTAITRSTAGECKRLVSSPNMTPVPTTTPAGMVPMFRVIVVVQWTSDKNCTTSIVTNPCKYEVMTLVEPSTPDAEWVTSG